MTGQMIVAVNGFGAAVVVEHVAVAHAAADAAAAAAAASCGIEIAEFDAEEF
jgi:hypothetical protein